ncbi:Serine/threonine protein kinase [Ruminococcus sp. YRD2003]|uniref:protein kinase domain-containing protein n=1 Tax=Ruminococcus sp. YRD2003 TaxID=1452313 RepID=UPI0008AB6410|nr:Serine/threonine protein kinase [Ruminococcus flavefaciens]
MKTSQTNNENSEQEISLCFNDIYGYEYKTKEKIQEGGQGAVFLASEKGIALKLAFGENKRFLDKNTLSEKEIAEKNKEFLRLILLPLPPNTNITLPVSVFKDAVGYTMRLMEDMTSFEKRFMAERSDTSKSNYTNDWLEETFSDSKDIKSQFADYIYSGGARGRLHAYYLYSCVIAKIHSQGLVYCDISDNNVFITENEHDFEKDHVWLIDADNLNYQSEALKTSYYTPGYGAPEVCSGKGASFNSDCYAFAVSLFWSLVMNHPFKGTAYENYDGTLNEADEMLENGDFDFVLDENGENIIMGIYQPICENVLSDGLKNVFMRMFTTGKFDIRKRPSMMEISDAIADSLDNSLMCSACGMPYRNDEEKCQCFWCGSINNVLSINAYSAEERNCGSFNREIAENNTINIPSRIIRGNDVFNTDNMLMSVKLSDTGMDIVALNNDILLYISENKQRIYGSYELDKRKVSLLAHDTKCDKEYCLEVEIL